MAPFVGEDEVVKPKREFKKDFNVDVSLELVKSRQFASQATVMLGLPSERDPLAQRKQQEQLAKLTQITLDGKKGIFTQTLEEMKAKPREDVFDRFRVFTLKAAKEIGIENWFKLWNADEREKAAVYGGKVRDYSEELERKHKQRGAMSDAVLSMYQKAVEGKSGAEKATITKDFINAAISYGFDAGTVCRTVLGAPERKALGARRETLSPGERDALFQAVNQTVQQRIEYIREQLALLQRQAKSSATQEEKERYYRELEGHIGQPAAKLMRESIENPSGAGGAMVSLSSVNRTIEEQAEARVKLNLGDLSCQPKKLKGANTAMS